jgi:hypothetical protein
MLFKCTFIGCAPLFSYMDSKCHHRKPSRPLCVSHPSADQRTQNESVHTFTDPCTQANPYTHQPSHPLGPVHPNLGVPCLFLFLMVGKDPWRVRAPKVPTFPTSATVGCWINPKFCLLEDLGEGFCTLLT